MEDQAPPLEDTNGKIINGDLLELIGQTDRLPPLDTLKLAAFFRKFPPSLASLASTLMEDALGRMVTDHRAQDVMQAINNVDRALWGEAEDVVDGCQETQNDNDDPPEDNWCWWSFRWVDFRNTGMVIQTLIDDQGHETSSYIVGVSPDPKKLSLS